MNLLMQFFVQSKYVMKSLQTSLAPANQTAQLRISIVNNLVRVCVKQEKRSDS